MNERPFVVCHMVSAVDGKINGAWFGLSETRAALSANSAIREAYGCTAVLNGAVTCAEIYADGYVGDLPNTENACDRTDFLPHTEETHTVICVDTEGTLAWHGPTAERRGQVSRAVEVLCENVRDAYLAYLRARGVAYIFAGADTLDVPLLLQKLKRLGIDRLMVTGGGAVNWSFLQAGCMDECSLVIAPTVSGETDAAAVFDRSRFLPDGKAIAFDLIDVQKLDGGAVWVRYKPKNTAERK